MSLILCFSPGDLPDWRVTLDPDKCAGGRRICTQDLVLNTILRLRSSKSAQPILAALEGIAEIGQPWPDLDILPGALTLEQIPQEAGSRLQDEISRRIVVDIPHKCVQLMENDTCDVLSWKDLAPLPADACDAYEDLVEEIQGLDPIEAVMHAARCNEPPETLRFVAGLVAGAAHLLTISGSIRYPGPSDPNPIRALGWMAAWMTLDREDVSLDPISGSQLAVRLWEALQELGHLASDRPWAPRRLSRGPGLAQLIRCADPEALANAERISPQVSALEACDPAVSTFVLALMQGSVAPAREAGNPLSSHQRLKGYQVVQDLFRAIGLSRAPIPSLDDLYG